MHKPVLYAPSFKKLFKLAVDASNAGEGGVLLQEDDLGIEHPICYFSKKFEKGQRNYCTSEKELLALLIALQHSEVYVCEVRIQWIKGQSVWFFCASLLTTLMVGVDFYYLGSIIKGRVPHFIIMIGIDK